MIIKKSKLKDFITQCEDSISWSDTELNQIYPHLEQICLYNGGKIIGKGKVDEEVKDRFLMKLLRDGIQKVMNHYAQTVDIDIRTEKYYTEKEDLEAPFQFLESSKFVDKIDLNSADAEDLTSLNGIGKTYSERIVEFREKNGPFEDIRDLLEVNGIGPNNIRRFWYAVKATPPKKRTIFISPSLLKFKEEPSLPNYFKLVKGTGGVFTTIDGAINFKKFKEELTDEKKYKEIIIDEIRKITEYIKNNPYPAHGKYGSTKKKRIREWNERRRKVKKIEENSPSDGIKFAVLDDTEYFDFLKKILKKAEKRIHIVMFLMHHEEGDESSTKALLDEIVSAKKRGVDVKVILDRGEEGCNHSSNVINKNSFEFLTKNNVPVIPDKSDSKTHTKLVLIDNEHSIIGSHNWTASSFFRYDDKSVYIQSKEMSEKFSTHFKSLWDSYESGENW